MALCNLVVLLRPSVRVDEGVFLVIGREIGRGKLPYRDIWDHKMPGIYWLTWGLTRLPLTESGLRLLFGLMCILCFWPLAVAERMLVPGRRLVAACLPGALIFHRSLGGNQILTEHGEAGFVILSLGAAVLASQAATPTRRYVLAGTAGLTLSLAVAFRPTAFMYLVPLLWLSAATPAPHSGTRFATVGSLALGLGGGLGMMCAFLASKGIFWDCYEQAITANLTISGRITLALTARNWARLARAFSNIGFVVLLAGIGVSALAGQRRALGVTYVMVAVLASVEALVPRKEFHHYLLPLAFALVPLGWAGLFHSDGWRAPRRDGVTLGLCLLLLVSLLSNPLPSAKRTAAELVRGVRPTVYGIDVSRIRALAGPEDLVWAGGTKGADLYWHSGCSSASWYLFTEAGARRAGLAENRIVLDVRTNQPKLIVVGSGWLRTGTDLNENAPAGLAEYLAAAYSLVRPGDPKAPPQSGAALFVRKAGERSRSE